ncbi:hypothetical protein R1flu_020639 [Riccia fluitans]|uniref:Receptor ligand binding region domain-containing protein n=1 Tax=Riccia fluitans TaxID=41844 RepID=A0ABD1ZNQ5_9MARC
MSIPFSRIRSHVPKQPHQQLLERYDSGSSGVILLQSTIQRLEIIFALLPSCPSPVLLLESAAAATASGTYMLGFLYPSAGANIPASLSQEWRSAFQVAVDVLNANRPYRFEAYMEESGCNNYSATQDGASRLLRQENLLGAVGPACSAAVLAAAPIFDKNLGPAALVSFAATAEPLSNRTYFPAFFRTVYSDRHQAKAIVASMRRLNITNATVLYTKDYYSTSLASEINMTAGGVRMVLLEPGYNSTLSKEQLKTVLNSLEPSGVVVLVVPPSVAGDIWKMASKIDKVRYPWWYFGSDGVTSFEPADMDQELVKVLEGEIGIAPYGGDLSANSQCSKFYAHWQEMKDKYPGLQAFGSKRSRSYVPYLFDAVTAFYEVVDDLLANGLEVTRQNVFSAFKGTLDEHKLRFTGCTGVVELDPETGSRSVTAQPPIYDLVSLTVHSWELKGRISNESFINLLPLERPGLYPAPGQEMYAPKPGENKKPSAGVIAGIVFLVIALIVLLAACFVYYAKKYNAQMFNRLN